MPMHPIAVESFHHGWKCWTDRLADRLCYVIFSHNSGVAVEMAKDRIRDHIPQGKTPCKVRRAITKKALLQITSFCGFYASQLSNS